MIRPSPRISLRSGTQVQDLLLQGEVADGQFDSEAIVTFEDASGNKISAIASRTLLQKDSRGRESLRVRLLATDGAVSLVEVPGDLYGATRDVVVRQAILEPLVTTANDP